MTRIPCPNACTGHVHRQGRDCTCDLLATRAALGGEKTLVLLAAAGVLVLFLLCTVLALAGIDAALF